MNKDYLWDKTGEDPLIKGLEDKLAAFRYQEDDVPRFAATRAETVERAPRYRWLPMSLAFAGFAAVVIMIGVWLLSPAVRQEPPVETAFVTPASVDIGTVKTTPDQPGPESIAETLHTVSMPGPIHADVHQRASLIGRRTGTVVAKKEDKPTTVTLTPEEKYAYGQLMLALSITGSKLKLVQDTINRIEDTDKHVNDNNR